LREHYRSILSFDIVIQGFPPPLPSCRFQVVASRLLLPSCRLQVVASKLSRPSCRVRVVASKLSLPIIADFGHFGHKKGMVFESVKGSGNSAFLEKDQLFFLKRVEK